MCSTPCRAGSGTASYFRPNARMIGRSAREATSASLYPAPAGVSALYSVSAMVPASSITNASTREVGLGSARPVSQAMSRSSQSASRNWRRKAGSAIARS